MDPYLERADLWPNVHTSLIIALRDDLAPRLRPRYDVAVEERTMRLSTEDLAFAARPDVAVIAPSGASAEVALPDRSPTLSANGTVMVEVEVPMPDEVHEVYLEIRDLHTNRVVTVIELLSPANKHPGEGRSQYEQKRLAILGTRTHLVEMDLLRGGPPMPLYGDHPASPYRILISRAAQRPKATLLPFGIRQPVPVFSLPLQAGDDEPPVDLTRLLHALYDRAGYDLRLDYRAAPPPPPLPPAEAEWLNEHLRRAGLR
jgi:hypothetical protein